MNASKYINRFRAQKSAALSASGGFSSAVTFSRSAWRGAAVGLAALLVLAKPGTVHAASCGGCTSTLTPHKASAVVDGLTNEWNTSISGPDFWDGMYVAGNTSKSHTANAFVRYVCNGTTQVTVYVLVLTTDPVNYPVMATPTGNSWAAVNSNNNKVYNDDGSAGTFALVGQGYDGNSAHALGYEASFTLPSTEFTTTCFIVHTDTLSGGTAATSATPSFSGPGLCLSVNCSTPATVTIGDFVWNDVNANGIQDGGETGIANVSLTLTGLNASGGAVTDHTTTDATGHYLFTEAAGTYQVAIDAANFNAGAPLSGYVATLTGQGTTSTDSNPNPSVTTPGTLAAGASDLTVDFGFYQPVTIGNYVWNDLNGDGVQNDGGAAAGLANVGLTLTGTTAAGASVTASTTTDANGAYLFTEPPGTYTVTVMAANFNAGGPLAGYTPTATGKGTTATDSNGSPSGTTPGTLAEGQSDLTVDFGSTSR